MFCKFQNNEILIEMYQEKMDVEIWSRMQRIHIPLRMVHIHGAKITKNQTHHGTMSRFLIDGLVVKNQAKHAGEYEYVLSLIGK